MLGPRVLKKASSFLSRRPAVAPKYRRPEDYWLDFGIFEMLLLQNLVDFRGPLNAMRSGGREDHYESNVILSCVERDSQFTGIERESLELGSNSPAGIHCER